MPRRWVASVAGLLLPLGVMVIAPPVAQAAPASPDIVNGREPTAGEFGFLAAIDVTSRSGQSFMCGGSFASATQIVTAAHCFYDPEGRRMTDVRAAPADGTAWPYHEHSWADDYCSLHVHISIGGGHTYNASWKAPVSRWEA